MKRWKNIKKKKKLLSYRDEVDQTLIDRYFGVANQLSSAQKDLPSGVDRHTLEKVKEVMKELKGGISIEEMGEQIGASRTTARRYLEFLVSIDVCTAKHEYGVVGRPERKYYYKE